MDRIDTDAMQHIGDLTERIVRRVAVVTPVDRAAWLAGRKQDVTASVAGCLLGVHPYTTAYGLWAEKTGKASGEDEDTPAKRRGRLLEPVIFAMLQEERPDWTVHYPLGNRYYRDVAARIGATPDAFAERPDIEGRGVVQGKTVSDHVFREQWLDPDTREVVLPLWIAVQAIVEADLTDATWATVALMVVGRGIDMHVIDVPLHAGIRNKVRAKVAEFWAMVASGTHPEIDWMRDGSTVVDIYRDSEADRVNLTGDAELDALVKRYVEMKAAASEAGKLAEEMKPRIILALGNHEGGLTDSWEVTAKTQHRKAYEVKESSSRPLRIKPRERENERPRKTA
jgi:hypothetical protein